MIYKKQDRPMCGCGNTQDPNGYCDGSHSNN
jgi:CDGSH-type Zn-finger protein